MSETPIHLMTQREQLEFQRMKIRTIATSEWRRCRHCGNTSYRTERCPTCEPTIRRIRPQQTSLEVIG